MRNGLFAALFVGASARNTTITLYRNMNDVAATPDEPKKSSEHVVYLGDFASTEDCAEACVANPDCNTFKYHQEAFGEPWAKGCYGRLSDWKVSREPWNLIDSGMVGAPPPPPPCTSEYDCTLSGECQEGVCKCYAGWKGHDCGQLDLLPLQSELAPAYGRQPTESEPGLASWGASIVRDPDDARIWHMYVAEMSGHCGLDSWLRNSVIVHATADSPFGPFVRQEELLPLFAHEPVLVELPASEGGGYLIYKIGCADGAVTGSEGTGLVGPCTGCSVGITEGFCPGCAQSYEQACQDVLHSKSLHGPWTRKNLTLDPWDWSRLNLGLESHSPIVFPNGTVLTFTRAWGSSEKSSMSPVWLVKADRWDAPYSLVREDWAPAPAFDFGVEDSFMWRDPRGNCHALFHAWDDIGGHAFSKDCLRWTYTHTRAYSTDAEVEGGQTVTYWRRERPRLIFDAEGNPTHLVNGASYHGGTTPTGDWSFTLVQGVRVGEQAALV